MTLSTEYLDVLSGEDWTKVDNIGTAFSIQNTAEVLMEYSFTDSIKQGSYLTPYTVIADIRQTVYVRFYNQSQNGTISITRVA